jgi:ribonuclease HII
MWRVGLDEAGRGPCLGPLVVGLCAVPNDDITLLVEAGVKDSKELSKIRREELIDWYKQQMKSRGWKYVVNICSPQRIDAALSKDGLNILEVDLFAECLNSLSEQLSGNVSILADACDVNPQRFTDRIIARVDNWPWQQSEMESLHKADSIDPVVGMSSIFAKVTRDELIEKISQQVGFSVGSGYPSDPNTKKILGELVTSPLPHSELRWSWATIKNKWMEKYETPPPIRTDSINIQNTLF